MTDTNLDPADRPQSVGDYLGATGDFRAEAGEIAEPGSRVAVIKAALDAHQQDVWVDAGHVIHGDCSNTGEDGYEPHNEPFTLHQAKHVDLALDAVKQPTHEHGITAVALVLRGPLLLMVHRIEDDCWAAPGGKQEYGEPIGYTACRETKEETGLVVGVGPVVGVTEWFNPGRAKHYTMWWLGCRYIDDDYSPPPTVMEPTKHHAVKWVHLDALPTLRLTEAFGQFIEQYPQWVDKVPRL